RVPETSVVPVLVYPPLAFRVSPAPSPTLPELVNNPVAVSVSPLPCILSVPALLNVPVTPRLPPVAVAFKVITAPAALLTFPPTVAAPPVTVKDPPLLLKSPVEVRDSPAPTPIDPVLASEAAVRLSPLPLMVTIPALVRVLPPLRLPIPDRLAWARANLSP